MDNLNGFRDALKYVGGVGCLMMIGGTVMVIIMIKSHVRLTKLEKSDKDMRTVKLLVRLLEVVLVLSSIFAGYYLFTHYL